jgi:hypothetical protein
MGKIKIMKSFKSAALVALAAVFSVSVLFPVASASAASSAALSIVPRKNYTIEPGKSIKDTLTIRNLDSEVPLELSLRVVDFTFNDDGGTPKLMLAEDAPQTTWSLKPYLNVPKSVSIPPKASRTVDMGVSIPTNQGAGSYYSAIVYSSGSADGGNVGLSASGVTLVFTSIPGKVKEDLVLQKLGAYHLASGNKKPGYTFITMDKPDAIAYTLKNNGNVAESPVGSITVKHMFMKAETIPNINPNESLALIGQSRTFTSCIKLQAQEVDFNGAKSKSTSCAEPALWPGHYTVTLDAYYGQNGNNTQEIVRTATFWYLPLWFLIIVFVVLAFVGYHGFRFYKRIRTALNGPSARRSPRRK